MSAIHTVELTKRFASANSFRRLFQKAGQGDGATAVKGISLTVEDGEVFGLLGLNGAGKTTLIKMLATLLVPTSGTGTIFGKSLIEQPHEVRKLIGLVTPDERSFYWRLTGRQNLDFVAGVYNLSRRESTEKISELADALGLTRYMDSPFSHYSTGMRQKLAIARGLLANPRLLFMDEPTKGLDPIASAEFLELIGQRVIPLYKITVFITTHILREAEVLCNRVGIMHGGNLIACDSPSRLQSYFSTAEVYALQVCDPIGRQVDLVKAVPGVVACERMGEVGGVVDLEVHVQQGSGALTQVLALLSAKPCEILNCTRQTVSLEASFARIISDNQNVQEKPSC